MKYKKTTLLKVLADIFAVNLSLFITLVVRLIEPVAKETDLPFSEHFKQYIPSLLIAIPILSAVLVVIYVIFGIYRILWRFARVRDAYKISGATGTVFVIFAGIHIIFFEIFGNGETMLRLPIPVYIFSSFVAIALVMGLRLTYKSISQSKKFHNFLRRHPNRDIDTNIMLIGGGSAGSMLLHDLRNNTAFYNCKVMCIIDDDPTKLGMEVYGVRIVGDRSTIIENVKKYEITQIIFTINNSSPSEKSKILEICSQTGCDVRILPPLDKSIDNQNVSMAHVRKINVEDLLGRDPIEVDLDKIADYVKSKVVLVTGGGGSIGSELCRQIASHTPKKLIIFDIYENNAYDISNELKANYPDLEIITLIGSVRDIGRLDEIFNEYRPEIVYHAAAHKHVPLMEDSPKEAVKNNVFGTKNVVDTADKYGVRRFVMISTDKAVNPTNIMGASKRLCEMIVQTKNRTSNTDFKIVRFGNVLGSNGSVIPLFEKQIAEGGPVTVTDKRVIRYFMTIPEAVSLVLQAGAYGKGGEIFVLDMGKPMKIVELAENLIKLSGYVPYRDIDIKFIGLRPGEKLYEELLMAEEGLGKTPNKMIFIGKPIDISEEELEEKLTLLKETLENGSDMHEAIQKVVPTYTPTPN